MNNKETPTTETVSTIIQYLNLLNFNSYKYTEIFRGQSDSSWKLAPSISRLPKSCIEEDLMGFYSWNELEDYLLKSFMQQAVPYMSFNPENKLEWLVHAQHHGLPTRLLDWTTNALKALYFAVDDPRYDDKDGAVFFANHYEWDEELIIPEDLNIKDLKYYQSKHLNNRIISQEGCFSVFPLPNDFDEFENILNINFDDEKELIVRCMVVIPNKYKPTIRAHLRRLGITRQSLFPGLDSVAHSIASVFY